MSSRTRVLTAGRVVGLASCLFVFVAVAAGFAADQKPGRKPFDPERIRKNLAKVSADLNARRREIEKVWDEILPGAPPLAGPSADRKAPLRYRFARGDVFAYRYDLEFWIEGASTRHRYSGTPYGSVELVEDGVAEIFLIGKLEGSIVRAAGESPDPSKSIWLASWLRIGPQGVVGGKKDLGEDALPPAFETLRIRPRELLFPSIPDSLPGARGSTESATLFSNKPSALALPNLETDRGTRVRAVRADPIPGSLARLRFVNGFITVEDVEIRRLLSFRWVGRFDPARGYVRDGQARLRVETTGARPTLAHLRLERLEGDAVREAYEKARAAWVDRPASLQPVELLRKRVAVKRPAFLKTTRDAQPGMRVVHLRSADRHPDGDHKYYEAVVIEADARPRGEVTIRYVGSGERFSVHPATLAPQPAARLGESAGN
ncbi:MAG: hypothetical protein AB7I30_12315 [Isosphaeraceae bacterium]